MIFNLYIHINYLFFSLMIQNNNSKFVASDYIALDYIKRMHKEHLGPVNINVHDEFGRSYCYFKYLYCNPYSKYLRPNEEILRIFGNCRVIPKIDSNIYNYRRIIIDNNGRYIANRYNYDYYKKIKNYFHIVNYPCDKIEIIESIYNIHINYVLPSLKFIECIELFLYVSLPNLQEIKVYKSILDCPLPNLKFITGNYIKINNDMPSLEYIKCVKIKISDEFNIKYQLNNLKKIICNSIDLDFNLPSLKYLSFGDEYLVHFPDINDKKRKFVINNNDSLFDKLPNIETLIIHKNVSLNKTLPSLKKLVCKTLKTHKKQYLEEIIFENNFNYENFTKLINNLNINLFPNLKSMFFCNKNVYYKLIDNEWNFYCNNYTIFNREKYFIPSINKNLIVHASTYRLYFKNLKNLVINFYNNNVFPKLSYYYLKNIKNITLNTSYDIYIDNILKVKSLKINKNMLNFQIVFNDNNKHNNLSSKLIINTLFLYKYKIINNKIIGNSQFKTILKRLLLQLINSNEERSEQPILYNTYRKNINNLSDSEKININYITNSRNENVNNLTNSEIKLLNIIKLITDRKIKNSFIDNKNNNDIIDNVVNNLSKITNRHSLKTKKALNYLIDNNYTLTSDDNYFYLIKN